MARNGGASGASTGCLALEQGRRGTDFVAGVALGGPVLWRRMAGGGCDCDGRRRAPSQLAICASPALQFRCLGTAQQSAVGNERNYVPRLNILCLYLNISSILHRSVASDDEAADSIVLGGQETAYLADCYKYIKIETK